MKTSTLALLRDFNEWAQSWGWIKVEGSVEEVKRNTEVKYDEAKAALRARLEELELTEAKYDDLMESALDD